MGITPRPGPVHICERHPLDPPAAGAPRNSSGRKIGVRRRPHAGPRLKSHAHQRAGSGAPWTGHGTRNPTDPGALPHRRCTCSPGYPPAARTPRAAGMAADCWAQGRLARTSQQPHYYCTFTIDITDDVCVGQHHVPHFPDYPIPPRRIQTEAHPQTTRGKHCVA